MVLRTRICFTTKRRSLQHQRDMAHQHRIQKADVTNTWARVSRDTWKLSLLPVAVSTRFTTLLHSTSFEWLETNVVLQWQFNGDRLQPVFLERQRDGPDDGTGLPPLGLWSYIFLNYRETAQEYWKGRAGTSAVIFSKQTFSFLSQAARQYSWVPNRWSLPQLPLLISATLHACSKQYNSLITMRFKELPFHIEMDVLTQLLEKKSSKMRRRHSSLFTAPCLPRQDKKGGILRIGRHAINKASAVQPGCGMLWTWTTEGKYWQRQEMQKVMFTQQY